MEVCAHEVHACMCVCVCVMAGLYGQCRVVVVCTESIVCMFGCGSSLRTVLILEKNVSLPDPCVFSH